MKSVITSLAWSQSAEGEVPRIDSRIPLYFLLSSLAIGISAPNAFSYPESELASVRSPQENQLRDLRLAQVKELQALIARRMAPNRKADFYFRLAELYIELYQAEFLDEGKVHDQRVANGKSTALIDRSSSKLYLNKGIQACQELVNLNIPYDKMDRVYGFLGFYYTQLGKTQEAREALRGLITRYPNSEYVADAYASIGDMAFTMLDYDEAANYYKLFLKKRRSVETGSDSIQIPRVLHKLSWAQYRQKHYREAIDTMKEAVSLASRSDKLLNVREEGLRDLAYFMSEHGNPDEAVRYFENVSGDKVYYIKSLERLAREFERTADSERAQSVYENVLSQNLDADSKLRVLFRLVDLDLRKRKIAQAAERIEKNDVPSPEGEEGRVAFQNLRALIRRTATINHQSWRSNPENRVYLLTAERFYKIYLDRFVREENVREKAEIEMYLAEVKRDLGKSREASILYQSVLRSRDERYAKEAGTYWVASLAEAIKKQGKTPGTVGENPSELELEFVKASDELARILPDAQESKEARIRSAQVLAGYSSTQRDALQRTSDLVLEHSATEQGLRAAKLWMQTLTDRLPDSPSEAVKRKDVVDALEDALQSIRRNKTLLETDRRIGKGQVLKLIQANTARLEVIKLARLENDKDYEGAARMYERVAANHPGTIEGEKALASAVNNYLLGDKEEEADRVRAHWSQTYPSSRLFKDSLRASATQQFLLGNYSVAGDLFQKLGQTGTDANALETAARLWEGLENTGRAVEAWAQFKNRYPSSPKRDQAFLSIGQLEEARDHLDQASVAYESCTIVRGEKRAECGVRLAKLWLKRKNVEHAKRAINETVRVKDIGKEKSPFVALAHFMMAELMEESTNFPPLSTEKANLQSALSKRIAFFQKLAQMHKEALLSGGPWGIAALYRQAYVLVQFADEIQALGPETHAIAAAQKKKALETLQDAYDRAVKGEILSPANPEIGDLISSLGGATPKRAQGFRGRFRLAGIPATGGSEGLAASLRKVRARLEKNASDAGAWVDYGNLLWGEGHATLARIAYERALALNPGFSYALNNRGVVLLEKDGPDDWYRAWEAKAFFESALKADRFFLASKFNYGALLNYYRLYAKAKPQFDQVLVRYNLGDARVGLAIALQGLGKNKQADAEWSKARDAGAKESGFTVAYHEAAKLRRGKSEGRRCKDLLEPLWERGGTAGFERSSIERLKEECETW